MKKKMKKSGYGLLVGKFRRNFEEKYFYKKQTISFFDFPLFCNFL